VTGGRSDQTGRLPLPKQLYASSRRRTGIGLHPVCHAFCAHVSHELGSPLTRVNIALALARRKADPLLEPELDRIDYETNHLNMLVEELLLLARLESGNELSRQTTSFNVASVIEEVCADARFEATQIQKSVKPGDRRVAHLRKMWSYS